MRYLFASWWMIQLVHGCAVYVNRQKPYATIGENATSRPILLLLYRIAHVVNGLLLLIIVYQIIGVESHRVVAILAGLSVLFEWAQAVVAYQGQWRRLHNFFAISMAISMVCLGWVLVAISDISGGKELIALCAGVVACAPFLYMKNPPRPKSWIMQMITINALYLQLMMII